MAQQLKTELEPSRKIGRAEGGGPGARTLPQDGSEGGAPQETPGGVRRDPKRAEPASLDSYRARDLPVEGLLLRKGSGKLKRMHGGR